LWSRAPCASPEEPDYQIQYHPAAGLVMKENFAKLQLRIQAQEASR